MGMDKMDKNIFTIIYEIDDGYYNTKKPFKFYLNSCELEDDMDDKRLENFYHEAIQTNFEENIFPHGINLEKFKEWAKDRIEHWDNE